MDSDSAARRRKPSIAVPDKPDRHFVTALARGLEVLACFRHGDRQLGNQDIARRCGLPKSTVSRLTHTLTQLGYLTYYPDSSKYGLGMATLSLGGSALARLDVRRFAHPLMQELADEARCLVSLGARDRLSMVYVDAVRGASAITLSLDIGSRIQIGTTAMGRAYLAAVDPAERESVLERLRELDSGTYATIRHGVEQAMRDVQELGVCCSFGEWQPDVNAIAAPIRPGRGLAPMAINCGMPAYGTSREHLLEVVRPLLIRLVHRLEDALASASR